MSAFNHESGCEGSKLWCLSNLAWCLGVLVAAAWCFTLGVLVATDYAPVGSFKLYEDGSWTGRTADGLTINGCIKGTICED